MATRTRKPNVATPEDTPEVAPTEPETPAAIEVGLVVDELPGTAPRTYTRGNKWTPMLEKLATESAGKWTVIDVMTEGDEKERNRKAQGRANQVNQGIKRDRIKIDESGELGLDASKFQIKARNGAVYASYSA